MIWEKLTDGYFKNFRFHVSVPTNKDKHGITDEEVSVDRRLQIIKYLNFDGAKINDLGEDPKTFKVTIVFIGENYNEKYEEFIKLCNQGTPGVLVLPTESKAYVAYAQRLAISSRYGESNTKTVVAEFIEDTTEDSTRLGGDPRKSSQRNIEEKKSQLLDALGDAKKLLQENEFVEVVKQFESGLSTARRYSSAVISLDSAVRNRILGLRDNMVGTISLAQDALGKIIHTDSGVGTEENFYNIDRGSTDFSSTIDEDTGQEVISATELDEEEQGETLPESQESSGTSKVKVSNLQSEAGVQLFADEIKLSLESSNESLATDTGGNSEEATNAVGVAVAKLKEFSDEFNKGKGQPYLVPFEMSLIEVIFAHDRSLEDLLQISLMNAHLPDRLAINAGDVVYI